MLSRAAFEVSRGITDEAVEAAARVIYEHRVGLAWGVKAPHWDSIPQSARDEWREIARAGLQAAGSVAPVHLCDTCPGGLKCERKDDVEYACADGPFPAKAVIVECELREKWIEYVKLLQKEDESRAGQGSASQGR